MEQEHNFKFASKTRTIPIYLYFQNICKLYTGGLELMKKMDLLWDSRLSKMVRIYKFLFQKEIFIV